MMFWPIKVLMAVWMCRKKISLLSPLAHFKPMHLFDSTITFLFKNNIINVTTQNVWNNSVVMSIVSVLNYIVILLFSKLLRL